jgi:hypothetical protein
LNVSKDVRGSYPQSAINGGNPVNLLGSAAAVKVHHEQ